MGITFTWSNDYSVGNEELDNHHRYLLELGNTIQSAKPEEARTYVMTLYKYITDHFTREEHHMKSLGYPGVERHRKIHDDMITEFNTLSENFRPEMVDKLVLFLHNWLLNHVMNEDAKYAAYAKSHGQ
jgi:hemerythrin